VFFSICETQEIYLADYRFPPVSSFGANVVCSEIQPNRNSVFSHVTVLQPIGPGGLRIEGFSSPKMKEGAGTTAMGQDRHG
jgi:hypothetical protein